MQNEERTPEAGASTGPARRYIVQVWKESPEAPWRGVLRDTATGRVRPFRDVDEILALFSEEDAVLEVLSHDETPPTGRWPDSMEERAGVGPGVDQDQLLDTPIGEIFAEAGLYPQFATASLLEALALPAGQGVSGAVGALLRAAAAAILCASHPDVASSRGREEIIKDVDACLASGDAEAMLALARQITSEL